MRYALVNPRWSFEGSTYFGCPEPHFPLELLSAREFLHGEGHEVLLVDANMEEMPLDEARAKVAAFEPDFVVTPTAPSYLFWRCPQPELRVPAKWISAVKGKGRTGRLLRGRRWRRPAWTWCCAGSRTRRWVSLRRSHGR
jgi:anaerobic magnesium-protoporphyrin IX monomethyl ester cyclase